MREGGLLGWSTDALVKLDDEVPGIIARVLTAAPARRQAVFAALAAQEVKAGVFDAGEDLLPMSLAEVATIEAAQAKCDALGIPRHDEDAGGASWRSYRQFTREMDWD